MTKHLTNQKQPQFIYLYNEEPETTGSSQFTSGCQLPRTSDHFTVKLCALGKKSAVVMSFHHSNKCQSEWNCCCLCCTYRKQQCYSREKSQMLDCIRIGTRLRTASFSSSTHISAARRDADCSARTNNPTN
jgi:hypothetical protein